MFPVVRVVVRHPAIPAAFAIARHAVRQPFIGFEGSAVEQTIMGIAGHVSRKMLEHYSHLRMNAKRRALDAPVKKLRDHARQGYVTKHGTTSQKPGRKAPQLIEGIGGPHGIRTHDLLVANEALSQLS